MIINSYKELLVWKKALELSGADGVMIGRAVYGKPWLIAQVASELKGENKNFTPTLADQKNIVLGHFNEMIDHYGEQTAIPLARKHIGWYSAGLKGSAEFRAKINTTNGAQNVRDEIEKFYDNLLET